MTISGIFGVLALVFLVIVLLIAIAGTIMELAKEKMYGAIVFVLLLVLAGVCAILSLVFSI